MKLTLVLLSVLLVAVVVVEADHNCVDRWNYCQNGGLCHDVASSNAWVPPTCACRAPYTGAQCEKWTRECKTDMPCGNGATCTDMSSVNCDSAQRNGDCYTCSCKNNGYGGPQCKETNACWSSPCLNGGACVPGTAVQSYTCSCSSNSTGSWGDANCQTWYPNFDCRRSTTPCQNGGTCTGAGQCVCPQNYQNSQDCSRLNFCASSPCANGGTCNFNTESCACTSQYARPTCTTQKFCQSSPCMNGGTCTDLGQFGAGTCTCTFNTWGTYCQNTWNEEGCKHQECSHGGACGCPGSATNCNNNAWATTCECQSGWGDCQCNSTVASHCPSLTNVCWNGGTCVSHANGYLCQCAPGFYGSKCENYDNICASNNKCQNGGRCTMTQVWSNSNGGITASRGYDYWQCDCLYPYYGEFCENVADVQNLCWNYNPCQNGGNCTVRAPTTGGGGVVRGGYWVSDPTNNGQRKQLPPYVCTCPAGFYGTECTAITPTLVASCAQSPNFCGSMGTCIDSSVGPTCACPCGYRGDNCEVAATDATRAVVGQKQDYCGRGDVCYNGGTCYNADDGQNFFCVCQPGFWGTRCARAGKSAGSLALPSLLVTLLAVIVAKALAH